MVRSRERAGLTERRTKCAQLIARRAGITVRIIDGAGRAMSLCAFCGLEIIPGGSELCARHAADTGDGWADNNRRMCDLLHRGRVPPRLTPAEREEEFWAHTEIA
jgi:hypothetical protein